MLSFSCPVLLETLRSGQVGEVRGVLLVYLSTLPRKAVLLELGLRQRFLQIYHLSRPGRTVRTAGGLSQAILLFRILHQRPLPLKIRTRQARARKEGK